MMMRGGSITTMIRSHILPRLFALLCALLLIPAPEAFAQVLYGSVAGTVEDSTGAVVPGATVTVTDQATNQSRQATTTNDGTYVIPDLPAGSVADWSALGLQFREVVAIARVARWREHLDGRDVGTQLRLQRVVNVSRGPFGRAPQALLCARVGVQLVVKIAPQPK